MKPIDSLVGEEWRDITGYEGLYQISNFGRVKSLERISYVGQHRALFHRSEMIMRPKTRKSGYCLVCLWKDEKGKDQYVHRLVAQAFVENPHGYTVVNHKDENPNNNHYSNLEWCTTEYNIRYGTGSKRSGLHRRIPIVQKTLDDVVIRVWDSVTEAGKLFGRSGANNINNALVFPNRETAYGYKWEYAK